MSPLSPFPRPCAGPSHQVLQLSLLFSIQDPVSSLDRGFGGVTALGSTLRFAQLHPKCFPYLHPPFRICKIQMKRKLPATCRLSSVALSPVSPLLFSSCHLFPMMSASRWFCVRHIWSTPCCPSLYLSSSRPATILLKTSRYSPHTHEYMSNANPQPCALFIILCTIVSGFWNRVKNPDGSPLSQPCNSS